MKSTVLKNQSGFTLVEVMIVLSLFFVVISITFLSFKPLYRHQQINHFFQQLQLDLSYSQMYALTHNNEVHITFFPENNRYVIKSSGIATSLITRSYSKNIRIQLVTLPSTVNYLQDGTIRKSGKMHVLYHDEVYSFVFLFGKGQTYVKKL